MVTTLSLWKNFLCDIKIGPHASHLGMLQYDNIVLICHVKNVKNHKNTRHVALTYNFVLNWEEEVVLEYKCTTQRAYDWRSLTRPYDTVLFLTHIWGSRYVSLVMYNVLFYSIACYTSLLFSFSRWYVFFLVGINNIGLFFAYTILGTFLC